MRIIIVNKFLYPKGGDAICALATAELLRAHGHEVALWGMTHPENPKYPYESLFVSNVDYMSGGGFFRNIGSALKILYSFEAKKKFEAVIKDFKPDLVHLNNFAHQISPSILDVLKKRKIPAVMTMHDYKLVCPVYTLLSGDKVCQKCAGGSYSQCVVNKCVKGSRAKSVLSAVEMYLHHQVMHIYDNIKIFISPSLFMKDKLHEMGFGGTVEHLPNFIKSEEYIPLPSTGPRPKGTR